MRANSFNTDQAVPTLTIGLRALLIVLFLVLTSFTNGNTEDRVGSNKQPLSFGNDQTIIDLNQVFWEPLQGKGIPPGPEIAILRGNLSAGGGEALVRFPANYTFPITVIPATSSISGSRATLPISLQMARRRLSAAKPM